VYPLKTKCKSEVLEVSSLLAGSPLSSVMAFAKLLPECSVHEVWIEIWSPRWDYFGEREFFGIDNFIVVMMAFVSEIDPRLRCPRREVGRGLDGFVAFCICLALGLCHGCHFSREYATVLVLSASRFGQYP
jgi:hypothetical protein